MKGTHVRRQPKLDTPTARAKLKPRQKVYTNVIGRGVRLAYWRNRLIAGSWGYIFKGTLKKIAAADDAEPADDRTILDYWQACRHVLKITGVKDGTDHAKPVTVEAALADYAADLRARGGSERNATHPAFHLPKALREKLVGQLTARELRKWRDGLIAGGLAPASVSRIGRSLAAALNLAAQHDGRIVNREAWRVGLGGLPDRGEARNVILDNATVLAIVAAAKAEGAEFGVLVELLAVTGARFSQVASLEIADVQADRSDPRLTMPSSNKGKGRARKVSRYPLPVSAELAYRLQTLGHGRPAHDRLLLRPDGAVWMSNDLRRPFRRVVERVGLDPDTVTSYALRHSSIVRMLLAGVPLRVVAVLHDTSVGQIERTYSRFIVDVVDDMARKVMLDTAAPAPAPNVVPLSR
jgi:integrase